MRKRRAALTALLLGALVAGTSAGAQTATPQPATPAATNCADARLPSAILDGPATLPSLNPLQTITVSAPRHVLQLAVAADERSRELGLMCVTRLRAQSGMLFVFGHAADWDFWMKNTLVPLDMAWVDADGRVSSVAAMVPASTLQTSDEQVARRSGHGAYVIELAGGEAARDGIAPGVRLALPALRTSDVATPEPTHMLDGLAIFERAKALFRARARPPYVVYTLERVGLDDGTNNPADTYNLRIWYRSADHAALARTYARGAATGPMHFLRVAFNQQVDPGPPTADIFETVPPLGVPNPSPSPSDAPRTIQSVVVKGELDYRVTGATLDGGLYHLYLEPRREPERNRLRELWIDPATSEVRRALATDRLYFTGTSDSVPDRFDIGIESQDGMPLIRTIHALADLSDEPASGARVAQNDYRFENIVFPPTLPDWYFQPQAYAAHSAEAPST